MKTTHIIFALALFLTVIGAAAALPLTLEEVEFDDVILTEDAVNRLSVERGEEYDVRVRFTPEQDLENVQVRVEITGYEYSDIDSLDDKTTLFDADANVTYVKKLSIIVPDDVDEDDYKLRVYISDRNSEAIVAAYNLKVDVPRNAVKIEDVIFNPANAVRAGSALLTTVRVENKGERDQDDVKVTVTIPGLGLSGTEYVEEVENGDEEEETEEIFLRIPKCAKAGNYDVVVEVEYSQKHLKTTERKTITVLEDETCSEQTAQPSTITLGNQMQNAAAGQTAVFPITITNAGKTSKTYTVNIQSNEWATVTITPTSMAVVPAGQTQTIFVNVQPNADAPAGAHSLTATVNSGENTQELTLTTTVQQNTSSAKKAFEVILIVLLVLLVILGIILGIMHFRGREETETYY